MLARVALAAREIEVGIELAVVRVDARADQHQRVRLEERAEVAVGEQPGVRRIACALEAVELERVERIDWRQLVDHEQASARPGGSRHLREHELGPRDVVEHGALADEVERAGLDVEVGDVSLDELTFG